MTIQPEELTTSRTVADPQRLDAVRATGLLDSPPEEAFDRLTRLAARLTGAPVTFLSVVDENRDFYKSCFGFPEPLATERQITGPTFCHYAMMSEGPLVINETTADPAYREVPTVKSLGVQAYLGVPLVTSTGDILGSFCAVDFKPRRWTALDIDVMRELAASTLREIELRRALEAERNAQTKLAGERRLLEAAMRQMPAGVMIASADGKVILSNARAREIIGHDKEAIPLDGPHGSGTPLARAIRDGATIDGEEIAFQHPDGSDRVISVSATPVRDGEVIAGVVTIHDITGARRAIEERDRLLASLDQERSRLRALLEQVPAGVLFAEAPSGRITIANRQVGEILGAPIGDFPDLDSYRQWVGFHTDGRPIEPLEWPLARALNGEVVRGFEALFQRADGRKMWLRLHGAPVRDAAGTIIGSIVAFYDVDEQRRMEIENQSLYEEARRANQAKDDFFAAVTHELRTPMTAIIGWTRILKMESLNSPDTTEAADMIESSARMQARLVDDLLDVSRIAAGKIALEREALNVNDVIAEAMRSADPAAVSQGIRLRCTLAEVPPLSADPSRLRQIFGNLLSNSIKFTPSGGLIEISSIVLDSAVQIAVRDTGRGISRELLPQIFDRGRQARNAEQGGLGLGLTIVRHLVEMHGGSIRADSEGVGMGATFTVTLPV